MATVNLLRAHGTKRRFSAGCRCRLCVAAERRYQSEYAKKHRRTPRAVVPCDYCGEPVRKWPNALRDQAHHFCSSDHSAKWQTGRNVGTENPNFKGGRCVNGDGYVVLTISCLPQPRRDLARAMLPASKLIQEHRLIMAEAIGRPLVNGEVVHHRNGVKGDNRLANLELCRGDGGHRRKHVAIYAELRALRREVEQLRTELQAAAL